MQANKNKKQFKKAFSLVELLVVIAIMFLMAAVILVMSNRNLANQEVKIAAQQIVSQLRTLQNNALTGKKIQDTGGTLVSACSYTFSSTANNNFFTLSYKDCSGGDINTNYPTVDLNKLHVTLSGIAVSFSSPYAGISTTKSTLTITTSRTTVNQATKTITIDSSSGNIYSN